MLKAFTVLSPVHWQRSFVTGLLSEFPLLLWRIGRGGRLYRDFIVTVLGVAAFATQAADDYKLGPDSQLKAEVPHGRVERFQFTNSTVFPGTVRDGGVYIPAQYDPSKPAALMVFQDGIGYLGTNGSWRVPVVFDNLIAAKEMPVTIAIFLNPG